MRIIKLAEEEFLKPENLDRNPDIKKAIKQTPVFSMPFEEAVKKLPDNLLKEENSRYELQTLEGPRPVSNGDVILFQKKGKGKYWAVDAQTFQNGFLPANKSEDGWKVAFPKEPVRAWKVDRKFKVKVSWGEQESEENGGMLVQKIADPNDFWIASFEDFKNYTILER